MKSFDSHTAGHDYPNMPGQARGDRPAYNPALETETKEGQGDLNFDPSEKLILCAYDGDSLQNNPGNLKDSSQTETGPGPTAGMTAEQGGILLKDLAERGDAEGLRDFARTINITALADQAVQELVNKKPENLSELLKEIVISDSHGSDKALCELIRISDSSSSESLDLLRQRWENGDIARMFREERGESAILMQAVHSLGIDKNAGSTLLRQLANYPETKIDVCYAILVQNPQLIQLDKENKLPPRFRFVFNLPDRDRMEAIEYLASTGTPESIGILYELAGFGDLPLAEKALQCLDSPPTTSSKSNSGNLSVSKLFIADRLKNFVATPIEERWPASSVLVDIIYSKYTELQKTVASTAEPVRHEVEVEVAKRLGAGTDSVSFVKDNWTDDIKMSGALKDNPDVLKRYQELRQQEIEIENLRLDLDRALEPRRELLERQLCNLAETLHLPKPTVKLMTANETPSANGTYASGNGILKIREDMVTGTMRPSPALLAPLVHEFSHHEQDNLMIRRIADQLKIGKNASPEQLDRLGKQYAKQTGVTAELSSAFFKDILELRQGEELNEAEARRADELIKSVREQISASLDLGRSLEQINRIEDAFLSKLPLSTGQDGGYLETARKILGRDNASQPLEDALRRLDQYHLMNETDRKKLENIDELYRVAKDLFDEKLLTHLNKLQAKSYITYRRRYHEVESHAAEQRTLFFANSAETALMQKFGALLFHNKSFKEVKKESALGLAYEICRSELKDVSFTDASGKVNRHQVLALLKSCRDQIDYHPKARQWSEQQRYEFEKLVESYGKGEKDAIETVHIALGLAGEGSSESDLPDNAKNNNGRAASGDAGLASPEKPASIADMKRLLGRPENRARAVAEFIEKGPIRETLKATGIPEEKAKRLEKDLLSDKPEARERALADVKPYFRSSGGLNGFFREASGRMGALALVGTVLLPYLFSKDSIGEPPDSPEATWTGG